MRNGNELWIKVNNNSSKTGAYMIHRHQNEGCPKDFVNILFENTSGETVFRPARHNSSMTNLLDGLKIADDPRNVFFSRVSTYGPQFRGLTVSSDEVVDLECDKVIEQLQNLHSKSNPTEPLGKILA